MRSILCLEYAENVFAAGALPRIPLGGINNALPNPLVIWERGHISISSPY